MENTNKNVPHMNENTLENLVVEFEKLMQGVIDAKAALCEAYRAGEHEAKFAGRIASSQPESDIFDPISIEAAMVTNPEEWQKKRAAIIKAISRHPGEDVHICAEAIAMLEAIANADRVQESSLTSEIVAAQRAAREANKRLAEAKAAREKHRLTINGKLLDGFRNAVRYGVDTVRAAGWFESQNIPHTRAISGLASTRGTVSEVCETLAEEFAFVSDEAAARRTIPERLDSYIAPSPYTTSAPSPSELRFIGANSGSNNTGLRGWFSGMFGR